MEEFLTLQREQERRSQDTLDVLVRSVETEREVLRAGWANLRQGWEELEARQVRKGSGVASLGGGGVGGRRCKALETVATWPVFPIKDMCT
jgi:hypothetical protein